MAHKRKAPGWRQLGGEALGFTFDAAAVICLRVHVLANGGARAKREFGVMVSEKIEAHSKFAGKLLSGRAGCSPKAIAASTLAFYHPWVRANRFRLSGKPD